jgi:putative flippase GtrA
MNKRGKLIQQFMRYFLVAGIGYVVDFSTLIILHEVFSVHYLLSSIIGFLLGLTVLYIMSSLFVFKDPKIKNKTVEIGIFILIGVIGLGILSLSMWILTGLLGFNYLFSKIIATIGVYIWNFFARRSLYRD